MVRSIQSLENPAKQARLMMAFQTVCLSGRYAEGDQVERAEEQLHSLHGKEWITMNSCGSALFVLYRWLVLQGHQSVVVQNNTFYATAAMAIEAGLMPVVVDSGSDCPSMSLYSLMQLNSKSKVTAVCLTHVGGWLAKDYEAIAEYCWKHKIVLIEDCAHVLGVEGAGKFGMAACWSFYATKAIPAGEGGALSTEVVDLVEFARLTRNYGKFNDFGVIRYTAGMNLRMSEWNAAVLNVQLEFLPYILKAREEDAEKLQSIAPALLSGPTNWYKYPVAVGHAEGFQQAGKVYSRTDQLDQALAGRVLLPVPLENSIAWAQSHACLPIGEGLYAGKLPGHVRGLLTL